MSMESPMLFSEGDEATPLCPEDTFFSYIKTVYDCQDDLLRAIKYLHFPDGFDADLTYGNGAFYKTIKRPALCYDIDPLFPYVTKASSTDLPLGDGAIGSAVFDPPFLTYIKQGREHSSIMAERFSGYWKYEELEQHYKGTLRECSRVLTKGGRLVFKCQDIIHNHKHHPTHHYVIQWAEDFGLSVKDIFILVAKHRMPTKAASHGMQSQKHARNFHSYFLILENVKGGV